MLTGRYIVLVEDDAIMGNSLVQRLELEGATVTWVRNMVRGVSSVRTPHSPVDAVVCDIRLPDGTGEDIFDAVSRVQTPPPFLFITGQGEIDQAVRLLRAGASDYVTKPFDMQAFLDRLASVIRSEPGDDELPPGVGISEMARQVDATITDLVQNDRPVLIRGQRGLGKGRVARRMHELSDRRAGPFVVVNAFEDADLEQAMFSAEDGTLFVSGVGRLSEKDQDVLVSAIRTKRFRLIASCGPRIEEKLGAGGFREDLFYTLAANEIVIPPLNQRPEDAVWLARRVFEMLNRRRSHPLKGISDLAVAVLGDHSWPGNGREVRARVLRAMDVARGEWIFPADLFPEQAKEKDGFETLADARDDAERRQIVKALDRSNGQMTEAARLLKVSRTTLWEKMQKHGL